MMMDVMVPPYLLSEILSYLTFGGTGYLAWRVVRAYERRGAGPRRLRALGERVRLLEAAIDRVEGNVKDVTEAQRFTTSVLTTRAALRSGDPRDG